MDKKKVIIFILLTVFLLGCAGMSDREQRVLSGGAIGAGAGAVLGAATGGLSVGTGAVIGAAAGSVGGLIVDEAQKRKTSSAHSSSGCSSYARHDPTVADLQRSLNSKGYDCGPVDGIMGTRTRQAIRSFQRDQGLPVDGIAGPATRERLSKH
jgi:peptidoglycan hydrolase-like protein with peptidoglycan-binding domain